MCVCAHVCTLHVHLPERPCPGKSAGQIPEESHMRLSVEVFCIKSLHVTDFLVACVCVIKVNPLVTSQHCFEYIHDEMWVYGKSGHTPHIKMALQIRNSHR